MVTTSPVSSFTSAGFRRKSPLSAECVHLRSPKSSLALYTSSSSSPSSSFTKDAAGLSSSSFLPPASSYDLDEVVKASSDCSRRLKRKEQNRLAQRRHRERQRSGLIEKKRRTDSGGSSHETEEQHEETSFLATKVKTAEVGVGGEALTSVRTAAVGQVVEDQSSSQIRSHGLRYSSTTISSQERAHFPPTSKVKHLPPGQLHQKHSNLQDDLSDSPGRYRSDIFATQVSSSTLPASSASFSSHQQHHLDQPPYSGLTLLKLKTAACRSVKPGSSTHSTSPWNTSELSSANHDSQLYTTETPWSQGQSALSAIAKYHNPSSFHQPWQTAVETDSLRSHGRQIPTDQQQLMHEFVTLVSQRLPWMDQLLVPRWDMIKVLKVAAVQLGLMFDYIEEDASVPFLEEDYRAASTKTMSGLVSDASLPSGGTDQSRKQDLFTSPANISNVPAVSDGQGARTSSTISVLRWRGWPPNMNPSRLCGLIPHHPFLDLAFPWPDTRDKILAAISCDFLHEKSFCNDVWPGQQIEDGSIAESPYTVHGDDAFDTAAYEVSNRFALRYAPLIDARICRRTNRWRRQSGKEELPRSVVEIATRFESFFAAQIHYLLHPDRRCPPMKPPMRLPWPIHLLNTGSSIRNGPTQVMPPSY